GLSGGHGRLSAEKPTDQSVGYRAIIPCGNRAGSSIFSVGLSSTDRVALQAVYFYKEGLPREGVPMAHDVVVIGGGVIGTFSAYCLAQRGARVTLLERWSLRAGASSYGNAGLIVPSYSVPMATPAAFVAGLQAMAGREQGMA